MSCSSDLQTRLSETERVRRQWQGKSHEQACPWAMIVGWNNLFSYKGSPKAPLTHHLHVCNGPFISWAFYCHQVDLNNLKGHFQLEQLYDSLTTGVKGLHRPNKCLLKFWLLNGQDKVHPSSAALRSESPEKPLSTNICPYYENPKEDSSGDSLCTRIILKLPILCVGTEPWDLPPHPKGFLIGNLL